MDSQFVPRNSARPKIGVAIGRLDAGRCESLISGRIRPMVVPAAIALGALGLPILAQEFAQPGVPPALASPRLPGPVDLQSTVPQRRTPGSDYFLGNVPFFPVTNPEHGHYNFKVGNLTGSFFAATSFSYTDNALFAANTEGSGDFMITPSAGVNLHYPFSNYSELDVSIGAGYVYYFDHQELNRVTASIVPRSAISYRMIAGPVLLTFYDVADVPANYQARPELRGNGTTEAIDFNRIQNRTGVSANWAVNPDLAMTAGYAFMLDRGLSDSFGQLDSNGHQFNLAAYRQFGPAWMIGLSSSYDIREFLDKLQNDSRMVSVGPVASWRASEFLTFSAQVGYSNVSFDQTSIGNSGAAIGVIDTTDFSGVTYQVGAQHRLNRSFSHSLSVGNLVNNGLGSNFTETFIVAYGLGWNFNQRFGINGSVSYNNYTQSGAQRVYIGPLPRDLQFSDSGDFVEINVGTSYPITAKLMSSLQYTHQFRSSQRSTAEFHINTVTLSLTYSF